MRSLRRVLAVLVLAILLGAGSAQAVTIRDIVELSKAHLSDDILLALIDVDRPVFTIDAPTLKMLKDAGVSEAVIVAIIRSGRTPPPPSPAVPLEEAPPVTEVNTQPQVIVIDHQEPVVREVAVPVAVPVFITAQPRFRSDIRRVQQQPPLGIGTLFPGVREAPHEPKCVTPVYWGFGGKLRPGSWEPPGACR